MPPSSRLGGFKILKDVSRFSLVFPGDQALSPAGVLRLISEKKINLPYITCIRDGQAWDLTIMVESADEGKVAGIAQAGPGGMLEHQSGHAILSLFPHKKKPEITGALLEALGREGLIPESLASSPSAVSVVLKEDVLGKASKALFRSFSFNAYRSPADWRLAQEGKEEMYREVVASYQERRPKVYGLEYHDGQALIQIESNPHDVSQTGALFNELARHGLYISFLASGRSWEKEKTLFCLPSAANYSYEDMISRTAHEISLENRTPVVVFAMNGPHFGDRYGIASALLRSFERYEIDLLGLGCTIASITGVLPARHLEPAIQAIKECFDVPSVTKKE